jgi:peptidoglycan-associated lipoprotein
MTRTIIAMLALSLAAGCGSDPAPPKTASDQSGAGRGAGASGGPGQDTATPTSGSIHIDPKIKAACSGIRTAHFAFDSSSIQSDAADALGTVAQCFVDGSLKGKSLKVVGHADARGEPDYNFALGQRRAGSVAEFLAKKGLEKSRIATSSRGETEAQGVDEDGWAQDRKVNIFLDD